MGYIIGFMILSILITLLGLFGANHFADYAINGKLLKEKGYRYFNENGEGVPIQREHIATGKIQTRTVVDYDGDYNNCEWYDTDINGNPLNT